MRMIQKLIERVEYASTQQFGGYEPVVMHEAYVKALKAYATRLEDLRAECADQGDDTQRIAILFLIPDELVWRLEHEAVELEALKHNEWYRLAREEAIGRHNAYRKLVKLIVSVASGTDDYGERNV